MHVHARSHKKHMSSMANTYLISKMNTQNIENDSLYFFTPPMNISLRECIVSSFAAITKR